jgi:hypothetical protein
MSYPEQRINRTTTLANDPPSLRVCQSKEMASWGEKKMKSASMMLFTTLVFASGLGLRTGFAQTQSGKEPPKTSSVTGCLVKGDEPNEVWLAQKDGRIYGLESLKIELNTTPWPQSYRDGLRPAGGKEEPGDETHKQNKTGKRETADFRVLTLKMMSTTCTQ